MADYLIFASNCHWSLFLGVQLTIRQHQIRHWLGTEQATDQYLSQYWHDAICHLMFFNNFSPANAHVVKYTHEITILKLSIEIIISKLNHTSHIVKTYRPEFKHVLLINTKLLAFGLERKQGYVNLVVKIWYWHFILSNSKWKDFRN